jgi:acetyl-CoA carboxylase carboxyltransferase component
MLEEKHMTPPTKQTHEWTELLGEFESRLEKAREMGAPEKLAKQRQGGRFDARQRIFHLCDPGSFREIGTLVGSLSYSGLPPAPADGLIAGSARINSRPVLIGAEDFTVQGGSIGIGSHAKRVRLAELALQQRAPLIMLLEGAGERVTNAFQRHAHAPNDLQLLAKLSGIVPTVALVMGASAGHGVLTALLMDFVVMVQGAAMFSAGPPLVQAAIGEKVTKEELGGAQLHVAESGVAHNLAASEDRGVRTRAPVPVVFPAECLGTATRNRAGRRRAPTRRHSRPDSPPAEPAVRYSAGPRTACR